MSTLFPGLSLANLEMRWKIFAGRLISIGYNDVIAPYKGIWDPWAGIYIDYQIMAPFFVPTKRNDLGVNLSSFLPFSFVW